MMTLEDLLEYVNESAIINLYDGSSYELIDIYYKDDVPDYYLQCEVTDIFGDKDQHIGIEIDTLDGGDDDE